MIIYNLEEYITAGGEHAIFTGTFNPPHIGHVAAIKYAFQQIPILSSVVIIPHTWNIHKIPPLDIAIRVKWLQETCLEFIPDLFAKTVICFDEVINNQPQKYDELCSRHNLKLYRIVGSDKQSVLIRSKDHAEILQTPRDGLINSTFIRKSVQEGNIEGIKKMVAKSVLKDILTNHYYS